MIRQVKQLLKKYKEIKKNGAEYVFISQVEEDLYWLISEERLKRIPKDQQ